MVNDNTTLAELSKAVASGHDAEVRRLAKTCCTREGTAVLPPDLQFAAATSFAKNAEYETSLAYYRRFLRFYRDHKNADEARYRVGVLYVRYLGNPDEGKRYLTLLTQKGRPKQAAKARGVLAGLDREGADAKVDDVAGPFAIVLPDERRINVNLAGRHIAETLGCRLADATHEIKSTRAILAKGLDRARADHASRTLALADIRTLILPESALPTIPLPEEVARAAFHRDVFDLHTKQGRLIGKYPDVRLVAAAQMRLSMQKRATRPIADQGDVRMSTPVRASLKGKPTLAEDYRIIDLFLRNPPRRLRLDERTL